MSVKGVVKTVMGAAAGVAASIGAILAFRKKSPAEESEDDKATAVPAPTAQPTPQNNSPKAQPTGSATSDEEAITEVIDVPKPKTAAAEPVPEEPVAEEPVAVTLKGVDIADAAAFVAAVNAADEATLKGAGLKGKALKVVLAGQPFASAEAVGSTAGVGPKSIAVLATL